MPDMSTERANLVIALEGVRIHLLQALDGLKALDAISREEDDGILTVNFDDSGAISTFEQREPAAMIAAIEMAIYIDRLTSVDSELPPTADEVRARLLARYQACYDAIISATLDESDDDPPPNQLVLRDEIGLLWVVTVGTDGQLQTARYPDGKPMTAYQRGLPTIAEVTDSLTEAIKLSDRLRKLG